MAFTMRLPWAPSMNFGMGVSLLTGETRGKGVEPGTATPPTGASGQTTAYDLTLVKSAQELSSSLGIGVSASGHYGLFSASGKFGYSSSVKFNTQATFMLARCVVSNAFMQCENAQVKQGTHAFDLLSQGNRKKFQETYGDAFVRGMQTGGEFFAVISIASSSMEEQSELSASLRASFGGLLASGSVSAQLDAETHAKISRNDVRVTTFQRGGQGAEQSFTRDVEAVMSRLQDFPEAVRLHPVTYEVQVASYDILPLPSGPNVIDIRTQKENLEDYERIRLKLLTIRYDTEFLQEHPTYFRNPPSATTLNAWQDYISDQITRLTRLASQCSEDVRTCETFAFTVPPGWAMPERKIESNRNAVVYEKSDFKGNAQPLPKGHYDVTREQVLIGNDAISSIKVPAGLVARMYEHPRFEGRFIDIRSDTPSLGIWDERTSSIIVYKDGTVVPYGVEIFDQPNFQSTSPFGASLYFPGDGGFTAGGSPLGPMSALVPQGMVLEIKGGFEPIYLRANSRLIDLQGSSNAIFAVYDEVDAPPEDRVNPVANIADVAPTPRGQKRSGFEHVQQFLVRFGYLPQGSYQAGLLDDITALALAKYQERHGLRETGQFDEQTQNQMTVARCALPDLVNGLRFDTVCAWDRTSLTYAFGQGTAQIPGSNEFQAVRNAFATWEAVIPLTFTEVAFGASPDIVVEWRPANDPDHSMVGGSLAHSDYPLGCDVVTTTLPKPLHFDNDEVRWRIGAELNAHDVESVAVHEIGHLLGLSHSDVAASVMFDGLPTNTIKQHLADDDIKGVRSLYWQKLDANPATKQIAVSGANLYQRHITGAIFRYTGTPITGWELLDTNPATIEIVADGGALYQRHGTGTGAIYRYTGTPITGWELLDTNPNTKRIGASGGNLYQLHGVGAIYRYTGTPITGWQELDNNPDTTQIAAAGGNLYQLHLSTGAIYRYTGTPITGWQLLDVDSRITEIAAADGNLYELLSTGTIYKYTGVGWQWVSYLPAAGQPVPIRLAAAGPELYKLCNNGAILQYYR